MNDRKRACKGNVAALSTEVFKNRLDSSDKRVRC